MIWRLALAVIGALVLYAGAQVAWRTLTAGRPAPVVVSALPPALPPAPAVPSRPPSAQAANVPSGRADCRPAPAFNAAAMRNAASLTTAALSAFGRPEQGWEVYAPLAAREIDTACSPVDAGFAQALSRWQQSNALPPTGIMDEATLRALNLTWLRRRPFVAAASGGQCPPPPAPEQLAMAAPDEGYQGKPVQLRGAALAAYRRMTLAARREAAALAADPALLTIFSGYRDPAADAVRCAQEKNCGTAAKANCSAHRTGLALDLYLGAAPGFAPESSADANRLHQSRSEAYRWLVRNAARFGFAPYPFEPWHWEWTGEAP